MEFDSLFTQEVVREFMLANGGKVTNPVLIAHFKNFLNDPIRKVANRQQFKTYVNTLATVKLDETGTKVLVLKKKFRDGYEDSFSPKKHTSPQISSEPTPPALATEPKLDEASSSSELGSMKEEPVTSQSNVEIPQTSTETSELLANEQPQASTEELQPKLLTEVEIQDVESPQEVGGEEIQEQPSEEMTSDTADTTQEAERTDLKEEASIEQSRKDDKSVRNDAEDLSLISQGLNLSTNYFLGDVTGLDKKGGSFEEMFKGELARGNKEEAVVYAVTKTSSGASFDAIDAKTDDSANKGPKAASSEEKILRVKDAALNIDKMENEKTSQLSKAQLKTKRESRKPLGSDSTSSCDMEPQNMTDIDREWLMKSCQSDYQAMCKLLQMHPHLASRKDFITGYNALHWACKNGNTDVVKLLCGTYHLDANARTSGGYTPLHLAAMMDHEEVKELLLKVYRADPTLRDYSGRQMKHYQLVAASKKSMHLVMPRKGASPNFLVNSAKRTSSQSLRSEKENTLPLSPVTTKPFRPDDSILMPPPTKLPPLIRRRPTSASSKTVHSDSETSDSQLTLNASANISGSTPNFETVV